MVKPKLIALIPARGGSKRIPNKNIKELAGVPLLAWTIKAAVGSGLFDAIIVSSDSEDVLHIADINGAIPLLRPADISGDLSPDIEWVKHALMHHDCDAFAILRPTNPFRTSDTIKRAWQVFQDSQPCDSIRAVELCKQHPHKMWRYSKYGGCIYNLFWDHDCDEFSKPYQALPIVYVQNASLEIAWRKTVEDTNTIAGDTIKPFFTEGREGYDINTEDDFEFAEYLVKTGKVKL